MTVLCNIGRTTLLGVMLPPCSHHATKTITVGTGAASPATLDVCTSHVPRLPLLVAGARVLSVASLHDDHIHPLTP
jgi:hypothetical protein